MKELTLLVALASAAFLQSACVKHHLTPTVLGRGYGDERLRKIYTPDEYANFVNRVLLIRQPAVLNDPAVQELASFKQVILRAKGGLNVGDQSWGLGTPAQTMLQDSWPSCGSSRCLDKAPFHLLGIVFRPDLADFFCGGTQEGLNACGAEIRFVFGLYNGTQPQKFAVILEFMVASQTKAEFQSMIADWERLATAGDASSLGNTLKIYLDRFTDARMRLSAAQHENWEAHQYGFDTQGQLQMAGRLSGEIDQIAWREGCALMPKAKIFLQHFTGDLKEVDRADFATPKTQFGLNTFLETGKTYSNNTRFLLSLNTCSGCHSFGETNTSLTHLSIPALGQPSKLSPFLSGDAGSGEPQAADYANIADPARCTHQIVTRPFNDLLRRRKYLDVVSGLNPQHTDWTDQLEQQRLRIQSVH